MKWEPDDNAWAAYIKFEMRQGDIGEGSNLVHLSILPLRRRAYDHMIDANI